jgi:hypothetical protein
MLLGPAHLFYTPRRDDVIKCRVMDEYMDR